MSNVCEFDLSGLNAIHDLVSDQLWSGDQIRAAALTRQALLADAGVDGSSRVVISHSNSAQFFVDLFAVWSLGACAACVNSSLTDDELHNVVAFTEPRAVLLGDRMLTREFPHTTAVVNGLAERGREAPAALSLRPSADADALILFTSGTTGDPKGVVHSFASLAARIQHNHCYLDQATLARSLCVLPTHFGHGLIGNCLTPLFAGAKLFLAVSGGVVGAARLGATIDQHAVTFMSSVPSFWKIALKMSPPPQRKTLARVNVGSAPVAAELIAAIVKWSDAPDVCNMYGITETANWVAGNSASERMPEDGLIGCMWGGDAAVLTSAGEIKANGEGELLLRPPALMSGYFKRPDLTAEVIRDGWYCSGDLGSIDDAGVMRLSGRLRYEINRAGMKVSPEEIDLLLERHPQVLEACSFALPDEVAGETVAVVVTIEQNGTVTAEQLRHWCTARIRRECVPERWYFMAEIPKTDRGKLNRDQVRDACLHGSSA